jgi:hypothetical protein
LSVASIGVILLFAIGEGLHPFKLSSREAILFLFFPLGVAAGMVIAWRWELAGGIIAVVSLGLFYLVNFISSGLLPHGPFFLLFALPGFFFISSGVCLRCREATAIHFRGKS